MADIVVTATAVTRLGTVIGNAPGAVSFVLLDRPQILRGDFVGGVKGVGIGRVSGTTKDKGTPNVPVSERVRLHKQRDGLLIRELWSAPGTGVYSFDYIDEVETYYVVSFDHDGNYRAVVADGLNLANGGVELIA